MAPMENDHEAEADAHTKALIAAGILDPRALTETYTIGQMATEFSAKTRSTGGASLTEIVLALREEEGDR